MGRNNDADTVRVSFLRWRPVDLADHGRLAHVADIQNDHALIAVGQVSTVFVDGDIMQSDPDLRQSFTQSSIAFDPVFPRLLSSGSPLSRKPPAGNLFRFGGVINVDDHENFFVITFHRCCNECEFSLFWILMEPESMDTAPGRNVGLEETHFARLCRIADIVKANTAHPGFDLFIANPVLVYD